MTARPPGSTAVSSDQSNPAEKKSLEARLKHSPRVPVLPEATDRIRTGNHPAGGPPAPSARRSSPRTP